METIVDDRRAIVAALRDAMQEVVRMHATPKLLVSIETAAAMCDVSPRTIEGLIEEGVLKTKLVRRKVRVTMKSLQAYADRC